MVQTVFDTDDIIDFLTLLKNHLNHDIAQTDKQNIATIQTKTKNPFKNLPLDLDFLFLDLDVNHFFSDKFDEVNDFLADITHYITIKITKIPPAHSTKAHYQ